MTTIAVEKAIADGVCEAIGGLLLGSATGAIAEGVSEAIGGMSADAVLGAIADGTTRAVAAYLDEHGLQTPTTTKRK